MTLSDQPVARTRAREAGATSKRISHCFKLLGHEFSLNCIDLFGLGKSIEFSRPIELPR
jgi:hypothetical protein